MNDRQRFLATMRYQPRDRVPLYDFNYWDETIPAWHDQGLPRHWHRGNVHHYFGLDVSLGGGEPPDWSAGIKVLLHHTICTKVQTMLEVR